MARAAATLLGVLLRRAGCDGNTVVLSIDCNGLGTAKVDGLGKLRISPSLESDIGRLADVPAILSSSRLVETLLDPLPPPTNISTSNDPELPAVVDSLVEELLELLALLFRSFPFPEPKLVVPLLPLASPLPSKGVSRSNPYCSNDRLNEVPVSAGRGIWSCGGRLEDMMVRVKPKGGTNLLWKLW